MINKKGELPKLGIIIMLVITVIFGLALMTQVIDDQNKMTSKIPSGNETTNLSLSGCIPRGSEVQNTSINESSSLCNLTTTNAPTTTDWQHSDGDINCPMTSVVVTTSGGTTLTSGTDYNAYEDDYVINMLNTTATNQTNLADEVIVRYNFCDEGYNQDGGARGVAGIITLFMAMALLAAMVIGFREWLK